MPAFEAAGGLALPLLRAAAVAPLLSAFGTLVFGVAVAPRAFAGAPPEVAAPAWRALTRLCRASLLAAMAGALAWLVAEAGHYAGAVGIAGGLSATPAVLTGTLFGHAVAARLVALVATFAVLGGRPTTLRWRLATVLCGATVCLHATHSHAVAMYGEPSVLLVSQVIHLLAAGAWLGGLLPLLLTIRLTPPRTAAAACRWFSPLGKWCVAGVLLSVTWQFWSLIGGIPGLIGTAYGRTAVAKFVLLLVLLGFAVLNRYRLGPALRAPDPAAAKRHLVRSIALQTLAGVLVIVAAALLSSLPPAIHEQPVWPLPWRLSLVALDDADLRHAFEVAVVIALAGIAVAAGGLLVRRFRWPLIGVGLLAIAWSLPQCDVLMVEAYPTSFYRSPTNFTAQSIATGAALYPTHCASCHGALGRGDGGAAKDLAVPPADLTAAHLWDHGDGALFWWLSHGIDSPEGGLSMPGFADRLSEDERWALIDMIRANNAGLSMGDARGWPRPTPAPRFEATCGNGDTVDLADLQGKVLHIVVGAGGDRPRPEPPDAGLITIVLGGSPDADQSASGDLCGNGDPAVLRAYALIAGVSPDRLGGTQFLIDPKGWLRALWRPGDSPGWTSPAALTAEAGRLRRTPLAAAEAGLHAGRH